MLKLTLVFTIFILFTTAPTIVFGHSFSMIPIGTYETEIFDEGAAEIASFDHRTNRLFVTNGYANTLDVLEINDPTNPKLLKTVNLSSFGNGVNSVAVKNGIVAAAVEAESRQDPGKVVFFDTDGNHLHDVVVGALPDMLTFTPNGKKVLVANEGEPDNYCKNNNDPEGSVSIIDLTKGVENAIVNSVDFNNYDIQINNLKEQGVRIFGPDATVSQDLEPEYITVLGDSDTAIVSLQENNAFAVLDIKTYNVTKILPLGTKDHSILGNGLDASDKDDKINIAAWKVYGMYMPDAITSYKAFGMDFIVSANEGDTREYSCLLGGLSKEKEDKRIGDLLLDPFSFPDASYLQQDENIGRLGVSLFEGDVDNDGDYDKLFTPGSRSFSIWTIFGSQIFDSGDQLEQITASAFPTSFNSNNDNSEFDNRSDNKGPEPEGIVVGKIKNNHYAFVGLERIGGIIIYDVSNPYNPKFVQYVNDRNFETDIRSQNNLGPEGMIFIEKAKSPTNTPLLVVTNEVSGTTIIYEISI